LNWAFALVCATLVFIYGNAQSSNNWDMIGYVASAYRADGFRGEELRRKTYADLAAAVPAATYQLLTTDPYRSTVATDPKSLEQQLPFYTIRPLFVQTVRGVGKLFDSYATSARIVSTLCCALMMLVIAQLLMHWGVSIAMLPLVAITAGVVDLSRYITPDAMAGLLLLLCVLFDTRRAYRLAAAVCVVLPLARTDFAIFSILYATTRWMAGQGRLALLVAAAAVVLSLIVNKLAGNYGWLTIFNFALIAITPYPAQLVPSTDPAQYARPYLTALVDLTSHAQFVPYAIAAWLVARLPSPRLRADVWLWVLLPAAFVLAHLVLFPAYFERFFVAPAVVVTIWLLGQFAAPPATPDR